MVSIPAPPKLAPILRLDLHTEVTSRLVKLIVSSEPGSRLPTERELTKILGVSRTTVREAVRSLAFVGAIQVRQGDGIYVSKAGETEIERLVGLGLVIQRSTVNEVIEARHFLEVEVVALAAKRHTEIDRKNLLENMQSLNESIDNPSEASYLDLEFHITLARASHNSVMVYFINGMRTLITIWIDSKIAQASDHRGVIKEIVAEHQGIVNAVLDRNPAVATRLMTEHLNHASARLQAMVGSDRSSTDYVTALLSVR